MVRWSAVLLMAWCTTACAGLGQREGVTSWVELAPGREARVTISGSGAGDVRIELAHRGGGWVGFELTDVRGRKLDAGRLGWSRVIVRESELPARLRLTSFGESASARYAFIHAHGVTATWELSASAP
ncbi:MAG: hypothetical protein IT454_23055 [Planctomycetes bacterium]|nr:hypothetical protein [Planctomycetota bacterium]